MNKLKLLKAGILSMIIGLFSFSSCTHDPVLPEIYTSNEPIFMGDCNSDTVYYLMDVAPIFNANCATSNCHDASTAKEGVDLSSYSQVLKTGGIKPFNANGSKLVEALHDKGNDQMPPLPANRLPAAVISTIEKWINQGAYNYECDEVSITCNSVNQSYASDITPILATSCVSCHSGGSPSGGINLSGYANVKAQVDNGKLMGTIEHKQGFSPMPKGGGKLANCDISKLNGWITDGAPNN